MNYIYNRRNAKDDEGEEIKYISREEELYPGRLRHHRGMPRGIYLLGKLPEETKPCVAIVGARRSTAYGNEMARLFAGELAGAGVQIISGMAWGIDGQAHAGALEAGGESFAVLGCGVDVCYPAGHRRLYEEMKKTGGILSEQSPGSPPLPGYFPARNRIISALADLVLVVEAGEKSGSLITADFALEQGKDIYVIPGRVTDEQSKGCLNLLKQGAGLADSPRTILDALGILTEGKEREKKILLAKDEDIVYSWIRLQPVSLEELVQKTGYPVPKVLSALVGLELKGCIREVQKNDYIRTNLRITDGKIFGDSGVACKGEDN